MIHKAILLVLYCIGTIVFNEHSRKLKINFLEIVYLTKKIITMYNEEHSKSKINSKLLQTKTKFKMYYFFL